MANNISVFKREIWSARLQDNLDKNLVFANLCNRDYEGDIRQAGDTIHIRKLGSFEAKDYTGTVQWQDINGTMIDMVVDKKKEISFKVDEIEKVQSDINLLEGYSQRASVGHANAIDTVVAKLYIDADSANLIGNDTTPVSIDKNNALEYLISLKTKLKKQNVIGEINVVLPPDYIDLIEKSLLGRNTQLGDDSLTNGFKGRVSGMNIYESNNVQNTSNTKFKIMAFPMSAIGFANQLTTVKMVDLTEQIGEGVQTLEVFGAKVLEPKALSVLTCNFA